MLSARAQDARLRLRRQGAVPASARRTTPTPGVGSARRRAADPRAWVAFEREVSVIAGAFARAARIAHLSAGAELARRREFSPASLAPAPRRAGAQRSRHWAHARRHRRTARLTSARSHSSCSCVAGRLLGNEMAPRVHNSRHWTIEGAPCSQFESLCARYSACRSGDTRRALGTSVDAELDRANCQTPHRYSPSRVRTGTTTASRRAARKVMDMRHCCASGVKWPSASPRGARHRPRCPGRTGTRGARRSGLVFCPAHQPAAACQCCWAIAAIHRRDPAGFLPRRS